MDKNKQLQKQTDGWAASFRWTKDKELIPACQQALIDAKKNENIIDSWNIAAAFIKGYSSISYLLTLLNNLNVEMCNLAEPWANWVNSL